MAPAQPLSQPQCLSGWRDEAHRIRIAATLSLSNYGKSAVIQPPIQTDEAEEIGRRATRSDWRPY